MEKYSNTGYIKFELRLIEDKKKSKKQKNETDVFSQRQHITNQHNNTDKNLALFLVMIPSKGVNQIITNNNKVINATILDRDKKIAIKLQIEDIINILDMIYKYENLIGYQNNSITSNSDDYKYIIFRDKKEKIVNVNISKRFIYFSNKTLNVSAGFELLYTKIYLEKVLEKIIESEINNNINRIKHDKVVHE